MTESQRSDDRSQARSEAAALLGVDIDHLSPADGLRVDMVSALRLVIDAEQASVLSGSSADLGKLNIAVQSLIALMPGRELPAPEQRDDRDDREAMIAPLRKLYRYLHEQVHTLSAENAQLRARLGLPGALGGHSTGGGGSTAIDPAEADITPPGELGECYVGSRPGPDDPKPPVTIDGKVVKRPKPPAAAAPAPRPAAPAYDYNKERGWRDHVLPDGTITPTPMSRGRWWGPV
jgi:hypothetical protein